MNGSGWLLVHFHGLVESVEMTACDLRGWVMTGTEDATSACFAGTVALKAFSRHGSCPPALRLPFYKEAETDTERQSPGRDLPSLALPVSHPHER